MAKVNIKSKKLNPLAGFFCKCFCVLDKFIKFVTELSFKFHISGKAGF